jgi:hypothetical protein
MSSIIKISDPNLLSGSKYFSSPADSDSDAVKGIDKIREPLIFLYRLDHKKKKKAE